MARWMGGGVTPWGLAERPQWQAWARAGMRAEAEARPEIEENARILKGLR